MKNASFMVLYLAVCQLAFAATVPDREGFQTTPKPSFEVASIKVANSCGNASPGSKIPLGSVYQPGGRYFACSFLRFIIAEAYQIEPSLPLQGVPGWSENALFQIEAKAEGNPNKQEMHLMVQSLLEERFKLKWHTENRPAQVYLLVVANGGHKLQPAKDENGNLIVSLPSAEDGQKKWEEMKTGKISTFADSMIPGFVSIAMKPSGFELTARASTMERFAETLLIALKRKVIDKTGLTGFYDIRLVYANPFNVSAAAESSAPSIFTAIKEQLGLRLEESKVPLDHFVIDSVEKPSEN